ncbi:MAG: LacI family DNA-binding transcriptional regulator [Pseudomonadota bacterium]
MDKRKTSLTEVADAAGVSKMTASRVLRNSGRFSEETRTRVLKEAARLNYVPNRLAAAFASESASTLVGVLVPRLSGGLFGQVVEAIDATLTRLGYQTMIGTFENCTVQEEAWLKSVLAWRPAGLILTGRAHSEGTTAMLKAATLPLVEIWDLNTRPADISVGINHFDCGYEMGRLFLSRERRRIGYAGADLSAPGLGRSRLDGFEQALRDSGAGPVETELLDDRPSFYQGFYATQNLLSRHPDLDAIYFQNDEMAVGGMSYCQSSGLGVPGDIGIAGWGGTDVAAILERRLTTTNISTRALGRAAAEALVSRIRDDAVRDVIEIKSHLIPGDTL